MALPAQAVTVAVSLDGVMTPMKDGERLRTRARQRADGKRTKGPAGYREVGCGTLSVYDADGERLTTVRMARMPESKKATLKSMLSAELSHVLDAHPDLTLVKLADGAKDNWTYLHDALPEGVELVDFSHAVTHLKTTFDAAYGEHTPKARSQFETYRHILLEGEHGGGARHPSLRVSSRPASSPHHDRDRARLLSPTSSPDVLRHDAGPWSPDRLWRRRGGMQDPGHPTPETFWHAMAPSRWTSPF